MATMKVRDIIKLLEQNGWYRDKTRGSHFQYKHPTKPGKVTVPVHGQNSDVKDKTLKNIFDQAGFDWPPK